MKRAAGGRSPSPVGRIVLRRAGASRANLRGDPSRLRRPRAEPSLRDRPTGGPGPTGTPKTPATYRMRGKVWRGLEE